MKVIAAFLIGSFCIFFLSCSSSRIHKNLKDTVAYCPPPDSFAKINNAEIFPEEVVLKDSSLLHHFTKKDLLLANAIGVYFLLRKTDSIKSRGEYNNEEILLIKHQINLRVLQFSSQISSIVAELDCEAERADQMANYLSDIENKNVKLETIASIMAGAIAGIVTSAAVNDKVDRTIGVGGGIISAAFGIIALFSKKKVNFMHARNMLTDVWQQNKTSEIYPEGVWYVLNERLFSNSQEFSISHNIKARWEKFGYFDKDTKLLTGKGGRYTAELLETRANMLNQMQAAVRQINQDLSILISKIGLH